MIKFIGSVYFTLILIAAVAIIVMVGTFLESYSTSHLFASQLTYGNPLFALLLWFFFLNILVSTLLRWPFRKGHIPFLITHAGLLMILGGQLVKHYYGTQGVMQISEGCTSCEYFTEHSQSLQLIDQEGNRLLYQIQNHKIDAPHIKIVGYHPNGSESLQSWMDDQHTYISGLPPLPINDWTDDQHLPTPKAARLHHPHSTPWNIFSIRSNEIDTLLPQLKEKQPFVLFFSPLEDKAPEAIWVSSGGAIHRETLTPVRSVAMADQGFGGYYASLEVPFSNLPDTTEAVREATLHALTVQLRLQKSDPSDLSPPLREIYSAAKDAGVDPILVVASFLEEWDRSGEYLLLEPVKDPSARSVIDLLNRDALLGELERTAAPLAQPARSLNKTGLFSLCCKIYGIELKQFIPPEKEQLLREYYAGILFDHLTKKALPKMEGWELSEKISYLQTFPIDAEELANLRKAFVAYLRALSPDGSFPNNYTPSLGEMIEAMRLLSPLSPPSIQVVSEDFLHEKPRIESPIKAVRKVEKQKLKLEDNKPLITFEISSEETTNRFSLLYDPQGSGLQWPVDGGKYLARLQPYFQKLPFKLKLRQARQINYAGTSQPYSYEADLWLEPEGIPITLSMNQVYETAEGYRLYLSGIYPNDPGAWKKVQIVINRDPGKYYLTYPGALLLMLGALLLFRARFSR